MPVRRKHFPEGSVFSFNSEDTSQKVSNNKKFDNPSPDENTADHAEISSKAETVAADDIPIIKLINPAEVEITMDGIKLRAVLLTKEHYKLLLKKAKKHDQ